MDCAKLIILFINLTGGGNYKPPHLANRLKVCNQIKIEAQKQEVDPLLALSIGWAESGWQDLRNRKSGARGPMQILPHYWCAGKDGVWRADGSGKLKGCDLVQGGVRAIKWYLAKHKTLKAALAAYGGTSQKSNYVWVVVDLYSSSKELRGSRKPGCKNKTDCAINK